VARDLDRGAGADGLTLDTMAEDDEGFRNVRLVLCGADGAILGALPRIRAPEPWWPEVEPVADAAHERFGVAIVVLRLLVTSASDEGRGGDVDYLAEVVAPLPTGLVLEPVDGEAPAFRDEPLRMPWARPGGVAASLAWADERLDELGRPRSGPARQVKSWNLSSLLRLPTEQGAAWCKSVPPFMGHEGAILELVAGSAPDLVPSRLAVDPLSRTVLLDDVAGEDLFDADEPALLEMVRRLVALQAAFAGRTDDLLAAGLPDWRRASFVRSAERLVRRADVRSELEPHLLEQLDALIADLPRRLTDLEACGLPETLVHGDFHPGNWRAGDGRPVLLDWGDSGVGHPLFDTPAFLERVPPEALGRIRDAWAGAWRAERPGSDAGRAAELIQPVAALRKALIYRTFLDGIEPTERVYHRDDPGRWLRAAVDAAG